MASILVVDTVPAIRRLVRIVLVRDGQTVLEAVNGEQALRLAASAQPSAILLACTLLDLDGLATAQALRAQPHTTHIPIILMLTGPWQRDYQQVVDYVLPTPFTLEALLRSVSTVLLDTD